MKYKQLTATCVVFMVASMGIASRVAAQVDNLDDAKQPSSVDSTDIAQLSIENLLDVKVVTASKKSESMSKSPAAVYVVDSTDIYRYGYRTLADALGSIVGLYISSDREFQYLGVRGYSRAGDYNGRFLLLIDGHRVNDPLYGTGTIDEDCPVDVEDIERIEVVKGPGSSLWGANALLAVVNVITRTGSDTEGFRLAVSGDKSHAEYGNSFGNNGDIVVSATGLRTNGESNIYFPEFDSPETNNGIAVNMDQTHSTHARIAVSNKNMRFAYTHGVRNKVVPTAPYGTIFNDPGTRTCDSRTLMDLTYEPKVSEDAKHRFFARVYRDEYNYLGEYVYDNPMPRTVTRDITPTHWWGAEARFSDTISNELSVIYGAEFQKTADVTQIAYDIDPYYEYYNITDRMTTRSLYTQASYEPNDLIHITLGTRYDDYSSFGSNWSPRAALVYSPSEKTSIKALYGTAFRAPNFYEKSWSLSGDPELTPEKIKTRELVWEQRLSRKSRFIASIFNFEISDILAFVTTDDGSHFVNDGTATSTGFEMQYEHRSVTGTSGYAGICMTRTTDSAGNIVNSPNYVFTCGLSIPVFAERYYLSPQIQSRGRVSTESGDSIDPETKVDLVVTSARRSNGLSFSLGMYNLLGATLYSPGPSQRVQDRIPQPARTLRLTVSRQF